MRSRKRRCQQVVTREEQQEDPFDPLTHAGQRLVVPDEETKDYVLRRLSGELRERCGNCRSFDQSMGQEEIQKQRVFAVAVRELKHDPMWYRDREGFGLCSAWDEHMVHRMSPAKVPNQFLDSSIPYERRDQPVPCPAFRNRGVHGVRMSSAHYVGKRRNYENMT